MNNKITISSLVALLALKSGLSKEKSEEFLKEFFKLISDTLREGESVKIKALGTFKIMTVETRKSVNVTNGEEIVIPEHKRIVFVPSREVAEAVNAPFSMFDSVELHPEAEAELEDEELGKEREISATETVAVPEKSEISEESEKSEISEESEKLEISEESEKSETQEEYEQLEMPEESEKLEDSPVESENPDNSDLSSDSTLLELEAEEGKRKGRMRFVMGFVSGLVLAMLLVAAGYYYFIHNNSSNEISKEETEDIAIPAVDSAVISDSVDVVVAAYGLSGDSVNIIEEKKTDVEIEKQVSETVDTKPSDKVVKDVIGPKNYLTTMAQRHYGNFNLWAYIYEENKSFLGHPDRIKPGTEVVIPPLSKYGIDPNNPADIKKAKRLGIEIYNRFK